MSAIMREVVRLDAPSLVVLEPRVTSEKEPTRLSTTQGEMVRTDADTVWVVGHRNPDTDCTIAAIAYATLKQSQEDGDARYVPAVLGPLNPETRVALGRFGGPSPVELKDVRPRVRDVMSRDVRVVLERDTLYTAADIMHDSQVRTIPVVGRDRTLRGVVTVDDIAERYLRDLQLHDRQDVPTTVEAIAALLEGKILIGEPETALNGNVIVGAMQEQTMRRYIAPGDLVIVGDRELMQLSAMAAGARCLIVVGGAMVSEEVRTLASGYDAAIISTPYDTYATARLVNMAVPVTEAMRTNVITISPDALIEDAQQVLLDSAERSLVVLDDQERVVGLITRSDFLRRTQAHVILVDHSQRSQSVDGLDMAEVSEVIDHHNIGDVSTGAPIFFLAEPVGATATLVAEMYLEPERWHHLPHPERVELDDTTAGLLLCAVISDTLLLRSPTTTARDRRVLAALADRTGVDVNALAHEMFAARSDISARTAEELVRNDYKPYTFGGKAVGVAQVDVLSLVAVCERYDELIAAITVAKERQGLDIYLLMITDIIGEATDLLFDPDSKTTVERAFGGMTKNGYLHLPGVVSRKKQLIPPLAANL